MSRIPIRIRVTLAFTGAMAVLLTALGAFVWLELRNRLNESIGECQNVRRRYAAAVRPPYRQARFVRERKPDICRQRTRAQPVFVVRKQLGLNVTVGAHCREEVRAEITSRLHDHAAHVS